VAGLPALRELLPSALAPAAGSGASGTNASTAGG